MTVSRRFAFAVLGCLMLGSIAHAARLAPVQTFEGTTGLESLEKVTDALMASAKFRGPMGRMLQWKFEAAKPGEIVGTLVDRKYVVKVTITYDVQKYQIVHKESVNLNYDGQQIHPSYNNWVNALKLNIDKTILLAKPAQAASPEAK
jgi:hypothetical protein